MMFMPSLFGERLFDDFMDFPFNDFAAANTKLMKTDIRDTDGSYESVSYTHLKEAMAHLKEISIVIYLKLRYQDVKARLGDLKDRGVALKLSLIHIW